MRHSNEPRLLSWLIFTLLLTLSPTTSLACKSETEVVFYEASTPASSLVHVPPHSNPHHLPRVQQRDGGGICGLSTAFAPPPPPSHAKARRRWPFLQFRPRSDCHHLPRVQKRDGGECLWGFEPLQAPPPPSHTKARRRWLFMGFRPRLDHHHHPRLQERDGGGVLWGFDPG